MAAGSPSPIFEQTYRTYLEQVRRLDLSARAPVLGARLEGNALVLPFAGHSYTVGPSGVTDASGRRPPLTVCVVVFRYLLGCPDTPVPPGPWCAYHDFADAAPLVGFWSANVHGLLERTFCGRVDLLASACRRLEAAVERNQPGFDLSARLALLPRIGALLRFNDADDSFGAQARLLLTRSAQDHLDMESTAIAGHLLAQRLVQAAGLDDR